MLRFLKSKVARRDVRGALPPGIRVYAVGDIHGRLDLFDALLAQIEADDATREPAETHLVLLGDLIDRGPESAGVMKRALELARRDDHVHIIMGNHEEMMLHALRERDGRTEAMRLFYRNGGRETLLSYGLDQRRCDEATFEELREAGCALVPPEHLAAMDMMDRWVEFGDYLFVHAGIRPGVPLEDQRGSDLRWIREEFLESRESHGRIIVHGHSISEDVEFRSNRIGIDTGAYLSGHLTALGLDGSARWVLETGRTA